MLMLILNDFQLHENAGEIQDTYGGAGHGVTKNKEEINISLGYKLLGK